MAEWLKKHADGGSALEDSVRPEYPRQSTVVYHCQAVLGTFFHVVNRIRVWTVLVD